MDEDGDDHVDIYEFMEFMKEEGGHEGMDNPAFFDFLDRAAVELWILGGDDPLLQNEKW